MTTTACPTSSIGALTRDRGAEGAELVVEVRSPRDETYDKIDFYSRVGVREMIVADPHEGRSSCSGPSAAASYPPRRARMECSSPRCWASALCTVDEKLEITWDGGSATV